MQPGRANSAANPKKNLQIRGSLSNCRDFQLVKTLPGRESPIETDNLSKRFDILVLKQGLADSMRFARPGTRKAGDMVPLIKFIALGCLWLPLGIMLLTVSRGFGVLSMQALASLLPVLPCGLPLAFACRSIHRLNRPRTAWVTFAILAPLTIMAAIIGGLLGPLGIAAYSIAASLPAWLIFFILGRIYKSK